MRTLALLAAALLLPACTGQDAPQSAGREPQGCFFSSQVSGFKDDGQDRVLVRIGFRESYELTLSPGCPPVNLATSIGIVARGGERICEGRPAQVVVPRASGTGAQRCLVSNVRRMSPQELATAWGRPPAE